MPFSVSLSTVDREWNFRVALAGPTLLDLINGQEIPIRSSCLGKGLCHQCKVKIKSGLALPSTSDSKAFTKTELAEGWRLSCTLRPKTKMAAFFPQAYSFTKSVVKHREPKSDWRFVCDLGTSGIEIAAVDVDGVWAEANALNRLILYGSDIMTRVECAQKKGVEFLHKKMLNQLEKLFDELNNQSGSEFNRIPEIFVAGNSVMSGIVAKQSVDKLAVAPYEPETLEALTINSKFGVIHTLPLIHSFIGGDLTAGLFYLWSSAESLSSEDSWVLVDVGTNSEILYWDGNELFASSTPAGPAFEGANISIGMRAEIGAIIDPRYDAGAKKWEYKVIGDDLAKGICGSALIDMIAVATESQLILEDGEVPRAEDLSLSEDLLLSQADIREFQLAKSALRTGIDLVIGQGQRVPCELKLSGNFGEHLNISHCRQLGLFPKMKTTVLGNTSLLGATEWAKSSEEKREKFCAWLDRVKMPIELALKPEFQEAFIRNMKLSEE